MTTVLPVARTAPARVPPHDTEAEQSVLGALMLDANAIAGIRDLLEPVDFYVERHQHIYRAAVELADRGEPIDYLTLRAQLERSGLLARSGGVEYISELSLSTPTAASVKHYADIVVEKALRRRLIGAAGEVAALGFDEGMTAQEATDQAEQRIFRVSDQRRTTEAVHIAPVLKETWSTLETILANRKLITGVPTNFSELDQVTQGLQPGELVILAARPSVGKTSLALNLARNAAVLAHRPVIIFSLEMSKESLVQRLLCSEAHVDSFLLKTGQADAAVFSRIAQAMDKLTQAELWIDDTPALSISALRARARRMKAQHDISLIVVDYLQLMHGGRQESRVQEVSDISSGLKSIAKELNLPVLALSQLSRESERRTDRRPQLSDLRDSGCLTGESMVWLASENRYARIDSLIGRAGLEVLALDEDTWTLERRRVLRTWATGRKPVFRLRTRLGRSVRASANHRFLTIDGWRRLDELAAGDRIALPRFIPADPEPSMSHQELALLGHLIGDGCTLPRHIVQYTTGDMELAREVSRLAVEVFGDAVTPRIQRERRWHQVYLPATQRLTHGRRNPIAAWLDGLGVFGLRSHEKRVPDKVFSQPVDRLATFLRHLWSTDGCVHLHAGKNPQASIYYATSSCELASGIQSLLLRLDIPAKVSRVGQQRGRDQFHVQIRDRGDLMRFTGVIGALRPSAVGHVARIVEHLAMRRGHVVRDVLPVGVWGREVVPAMKAAGMTERQLSAALGTRSNGAAVMTSNLGRPRALRVAAAVGSTRLADLARSDVYWDQVDEISADGEEETFDLSVDGLHNFVVNDIIVHNSIEQDADIVLFLYREGMHNQEIDKSQTQLIVAKNRNGPIRDIELVFVAEQTAFREPFRGRPGP